MKLAPRERKVRQNYLVEFADSLQLGKIYLKWGAKKQKKHQSAKKAVRSSTTATQREAPVKKPVSVNKLSPQPVSNAVALARRGHTPKDVTATPPTKSQRPPAAGGATVNPTIRLLNNTLFRMEVDASMPVSVFKRLVTERAYPGVAVSAPLFVVDGKPLGDAGAIREHNVNDASAVFLFPPLGPPAYGSP